MATNKNLQSLEKLVGICTGLGETYKPGQQKLQVEAMTTLLSQAQTSVSGVTVARTAFENATNNRELVFQGLGRLSTRLLGALIASGASPQTVDDARSMTRKLTGHQALSRAPVASIASASTTATAATPSSPAKRRARGRDYNSTTGYFEKLIETLSTESNYQPREAELQVGALKQRLTELRDNNSKVILTAEALRQARNKRDAVLYQQSNSVYRVGQMAKQYVKSVYGFKNDNHRSVNKLPFTNKPS